MARRAASNARSRRSDPDGVDRPGPDYLYRGLVRCGLCGQRTSGNAPRDGPPLLLLLRPQAAPRHVPPGHQPTVNLPELNLHDALFGPDRSTIGASVSKPRRVDGGDTGGALLLFHTVVDGGDRPTRRLVERVSADPERRRFRST